MKREMEYFLAVAREESITAAAEKLYIGQPAVSKIISALEKELGTKLFIREHGGVILTPSGKIYEEYARRVEEIERNMKHEIEMFQKSRKRIIPTAMILNASTFSAAEINDRIFRKFPEYHIQIDNHLTSEMIALLRSGKYLYAICPQSTVNMEKDIQETEVYSSGWILIVPKEYDLSGRVSDNVTLPLDIVTEIPLILQDNHTNIRREIDDMFRSHGITLPTPVQTVANSILAIRKAEDGDGCVIASDTFSYLVNAAKADIYRLNTDMTVPISLAYLKDKQFMPGGKHVFRN